MQEQLVNGAFGISPATVYGFLVGFMLLIISAMGFVIRHLYKKIESISTQLLTVITENTAAIEKLFDTIDEYHNPDKRRVRHQDHVNYLDHKFDNLKDSLTRK